MVHFHELSDLDTFFQWLFKTRMSFYGIDLNLPWWFGLSSWHYAIYGIVMLLLEPKWAKTSRFPWRTNAVLMIVLQAPLSFCADYLNMSGDSMYHVLDRMLATPAALAEVVRIGAYLINGVSYKTIALFAAFDALAIYCFCQSAMAQAALDRDGFVTWHYLWHMFPLCASCAMCAETYCFSGGKEKEHSRYQFRRLDLKKAA